MGGARPSYLHYISADVTGWTKLITRDHRPTPLTRSNVGQSHFLVEHSVPNNTLWQPYRHFIFNFLEETPVDLMINTRAGAGLAGCAALCLATDPNHGTQLATTNTHGPGPGWGWGPEDDIGQQKKWTIRHELRAAMLVIPSLVSRQRNPTPDI